MQISLHDAPSPKTIFISQVLPDEDELTGLLQDVLGLTNLNTSGP